MKHWQVVFALAAGACTPTAQSGSRPAGGGSAGVETKSVQALAPQSSVRYLPLRGVLTLVDRPAVAFRVELATTPAERSRGLMFRREVPADTGMLFDMGEESVHSFWMRNTLASLDMLFLDRSLRVVGVLPNVPTQNDLPRAVGAPSWYVLELAAGTAGKQGIRVGSQFVLRRTANGAVDQPP